MPISANAVVLRASYEEATFILSAYMQRVVDQARNAGFNVVDLYEADATQTKLFEALQQHDPLLVICAGHGGESVFTGQNGEHIFEACTNDEVMSGRQGIFHSCSTGVALGPSMVEKTAQWYAGWRADYLFMYDPEETNPLNDIYAKPFMECIIQPALTRVAGGGPSQMYSQTIALFNSKISEWWNNSDPIAQEMITLLTHDRDNYMVTGVHTPALMGLNIVPLVLIGGLAYLVFGGF